MKSALILLVVIVGLATSSAQDGATVNGLYIRRYCTLTVKMDKGEELNPAEQAAWMLTGSYIRGYLDGCEVAAAAGALIPYSLPNGVTNIQIALVIQKYLDQHPQDLNQPAAVLLTLALNEGFPNRDSKAKGN